MRAFDFAPLYRSTVGFDRMFSKVDGGVEGSAPNYPPYNIERASENAYRISVAVAGFTDTDLSIETAENMLTIRGEKQTNDEVKTGDVLYQGIAARTFERSFQLAETQKAEFLGKARALLFPIDWPEPFGLVMIEAMSAGTPVIAWPNGSVLEVVTDGVSGRIVDSIDAAAKAAQQAAQMDRRQVRAEFERRFTAERMASAYIAAYRSLLARAPVDTKLIQFTMVPPAAPELLPWLWKKLLGNATSRP